MLNFRKNLLHSHRNSHSLSVRLKHRYVDLQTELWDSSVQWLEHHNMACFATCIGSTKPVLPVLLTVKFRGERSWWATVHEAAELDATEHTHTQFIYKCCVQLYDIPFYQTSRDFLVFRSHHLCLSRIIWGNNCHWLINLRKRDDSYELKDVSYRNSNSQYINVKSFLRKIYILYVLPELSV